MSREELKEKIKNCIEAYSDDIIEIDNLGHIILQAKQQKNEVYCEIRENGYAGIRANITFYNDGNNDIADLAEDLVEMIFIILLEEGDKEYDYALTNEIEAIKKDPFESYREKDTHVHIYNEYGKIAFSYYYWGKNKWSEEYLLKINKGIPSPVMARVFDIFLRWEH